MKEKLDLNAIHSFIISRFWVKVLSAVNPWMDCLVDYCSVWKTRHQPTLITPPPTVCLQICVCVWQNRERDLRLKNIVASLFHSQLINRDHSFTLTLLARNICQDILSPRDPPWHPLHMSAYLMHHLNWVKIVPALHYRKYPQFLTCCNWLVFASEVSQSMSFI